MALRPRSLDRPRHPAVAASSSDSTRFLSRNRSRTLSRNCRSRLMAYRNRHRKLAPLIVRGKEVATRYGTPLSTSLEAHGTSRWRKV